MVMSKKTTGFDMIRSGAAAAAAAAAAGGEWGVTGQIVSDDNETTARCVWRVLSGEGLKSGEERECAGEAGLGPVVGGRSMSLRGRVAHARTF